ncbi:(2Fe-2S) ferredoxin [Novosphingobium endophyticum]|uniref:(2Fe-2S) ferredoxin n=1 Tax=Novosphingobium endophyticum TaxID=1955250 RepID=A0A916TT44_9SPHN|nr:2Fe-2S iron-sulfur cluster-binding protein [Novosphingobium endophyticum]GGC03580.1 (2Fe-2S) ferredoxin [Novosphingobium endophyticum]
MPHVTYITAEGVAQTAQGNVGQSVMEVARRNGIENIVAECGGCCACATCHVYVDEKWLKAAGPASADEAEMLDFAFDRRPESRLSCQIRLSPALDGLIVRTPDRQN